MKHTDSLNVSRRNMLVGGATSAAVLCAEPAGAAAPYPSPSTPPSTTVKLAVNGARHVLHVDNRTTLLDALREHLHLTGTKKGCDHGQCGACTIVLQGRRVNSCLTLAVMHGGDEIRTIEGFGAPGQPHPMQAAFVKHDGFQCGYCTPGQICSAIGMLNELRAAVPSHVTADLTAKPVASPAEIRERMSGNICRCGAYSNIVEAILEVEEKRA